MMRYLISTTDGKRLTLTAKGLAFVPPNDQKPLTYAKVEAKKEVARITLAHPALQIHIQEYIK